MKGQDALLAEVLELSASVSHAAEGPKPEDLVHWQTTLALQYVILGQSSKAEEAFQRTNEWYQQHQGMPSDSYHPILHLSWSEFYLTVGNFSKAEEHLYQAKDAFAAG